MSKTIEEIAKQYVREKNLGYVDVNRFLKESLFQPTHHLEIITERFAQSQTQKLQEQNAELVGIMYTMVDEFENTSKSSSDILMDGLKKTKEVLNKYNHLNKKP